MANGMSIFWGLIACAIIAGLGYVFAPKGENLTIWRSSILLTVVCCYILWALTVMAQLNPLVSPKSGRMKEEYIH